MKTTAFSFLLCLLGMSLWAQVPLKMSYQAVIRDATGDLVKGHTVGMKVSILQGSEAGSVIFSETVTPAPQTNTNGLVSIDIGSGTPVTGTFTGINWANGPYFLKTETDPSGGTSYTISGISQMLSVPYALYAKDVQNKDDADADPANEIQKLSITGSNLTLSKEGGTITIPGDRWGTQVAATDATLTGNGTIATPLGIADNGVASSKILDNSVSTADLAANAVTTAKIADNAVTVAKLPSGATADKYLRGDGLWMVPPTGITTESDPTWSGAANETADIGRTGKVGIGTTSPAGFLNVSANADYLIPHLLLTENENDFARIMFKNTGAPSKNWTFAGYLNNTDASSLLHLYYWNGTAGANFFTVRGNGNVGVGTASPASKLEVNGTIHASSGNFTNDVSINGLTVGKGNGNNDNTAFGYQALFLNTTGYWNTAYGNLALYANTTGVRNVAYGYKALSENSTGHTNTAVGTYALSANTTGWANTATGENALSDNRTGYHNAAYGNWALWHNSTGYENTALGAFALTTNTTGNYNTAVGDEALYWNTTGNSNTAIGYISLTQNTTGYCNTAVGDEAIYCNTTGNYNTATGWFSLNKNYSGSENTAVGVNSLKFNTIGNFNTGIGMHALINNTTGSYNVAIGRYTLSNNIGGQYNTAVGCEAGDHNQSGSYITCIGYNADVSGTALANATAIGYGAVVNASNKIVLGNASATTVGGYGSWTNYSDIRLKENVVRRNDLGLNFITRLNPVSFNYSDDIHKRRRDGLIAQEVDHILKELGMEFSGLIIDDDPSKTMNLSYPELVIPLINSIKELKAENDQLKSEAGKQQAGMELMESRLSKLESILKASSNK